MKGALGIILAAVTLDAIGIGLIFPILPSLLRELTGSGEVSVFYGVMLAIYAAMQFLFGPILGTLSDRFGRKPVLVIALASAAIDYLIMALSPVLWVLFAGRAIAGITAANMAVATAYIADISAPADRARRFGYMHACFGIGFVIGPVLGGLLGEIWLRAPFLAAALLNAANFAIAFLFLPESHKPKPGIKWDNKALNPFLPLKWVFSLKAVLPLLVIFVLINFVGQMYGTVWVLFGEARFQWSALMVGISLAGYGISHAVSQAFLVAPVTKWLGLRRTVVFGMVLEAATAITLAFLTEGWMVFLLLPVFAVSGVGLPALQSLIANMADESRQGQMQGVLASLVSLSAVFGPLFFAFVFAASAGGWLGTVWVVGAAIYLIAILPFLALRPNAGHAGY